MRRGGSEDGFVTVVADMVRDARRRQEKIVLRGMAKAPEKTFACVPVLFGPRLGGYS